MRLLARITLILLLSLHAAGASAEETVAVLGVEAVDAPLNMASFLGVALQNQVRQTPGYRLVAGKDLDEIKLVFGCVDEKPGCMAKAGKSLAASKLIWGTLKRSAPGYNLTLKLLDVEKTRIEKSVSENIGRGDLNQEGANQTISRLSRSFLVSNFGVVKLSANVPGAQVLLGSRAAGETESAPLLLRDVPAGTHLVRVTKDGYRAWTQQVVVQAGETTEVDVELEVLKPSEGGPPIVTPPPAEPERRTGWKVAFWTGAAVTVGLAVGIGVAGAGVLSAEDDKEAAIHEYRAACGNDAFCLRKYTSSQDACDQAESGAEKDNAKAQPIRDACDSGTSMALATNVLIGATVAVAAFSGFLYYKAYAGQSSARTQPEPEESESKESRRPSAGPRWVLSPSAGPDGAGLGFLLSF